MKNLAAFQVLNSHTGLKATMGGTDIIANSWFNSAGLE